MKNIDNLKKYLQENNKIAVAFSGGVDSAVLLFLARKYADNVKAYFVKSQFQPDFELDDALSVCSFLNVDLSVINVDVLTVEKITDNPVNRCYYCKKAIFTQIINHAENDGYDLIFDGTNASDDVSDRPGYKALKELSVASPLRDFGLTKSDIRTIARENNIPVHSKPSYSCLATRVPTGVKINEDILNITQASEGFLFSLGFVDFRVRFIDGNAKLELSENDFKRLCENRKAVYDYLKKYYKNVYVDLKVRNSYE